MKTKLSMAILLLMLFAFVDAQNVRKNEQTKLERVKELITEKQKPDFAAKTVVMRLDSTHYSYYDSFDSLFHLSSKSVYTYTPINLVQEVTDYENYGGVWGPSWRETYTYSPNNVLMNIVSKWYDDFASVWENSQKEIYNYNTQGQNTEIIYQSWDDSTSLWLNSSKEVYTYTSFGGWDTLFFYNWDESTNSWLGEMRALISYNPNQKMSSALIQMKQGVIWLSVFKINWAYDANNHLISETYSNFDFQTFTFIPSDRILYTNNPAGYALIEEDQYWDNNYWIPSNKIEYTLDANNFVLEEIGYYYIQSRAGWELSNKTEHFYTNVTSVNDLVNRINISIFPNPASDFINLKSEEKINTIKILNIKGQVVASYFPNANETKINVSSLSNGVYFLHAFTNGTREVHKIVVKH